MDLLYPGAVLDASAARLYVFDQGFNHFKQAAWHVVIAKVGVTECGGAEEGIHLAVGVLRRNHELLVYKADKALVVLQLMLGK